MTRLTPAGLTGLTPAGLTGLTPAGLTGLTPAGLARLTPAGLDRLPQDVARPRYDLGKVGIGVVHLGVGAFHRAHQAVYFDDRLAAGESGWAICGASLRSPETSDALDPQGGLYTLAVRSAEGERLRVIGSVRRLLVAPRDPAALLKAMTDPAVRIVSLTVTEKGYCHDPATGLLNPGHPDVKADLAEPHRPRSVPGFLAEALRLRRAAGVPPFTVLCCDNLPSNGHTARSVVTGFAALRDRELGRVIAEEVRFPSTMVDRIVPATSEADKAAVSMRLGLEDAWPVITEPFCQFVVEDDFPAGRPRLEESGVQFTRDVAPWELMKLRLLNGAHSTLAYLGYLAGYETVADAMADPSFAALARGVMDEAEPTFPVPPGADIAGYKEALLARFRNPSLRHRTWQIAMDGSQKLPQRLLNPIRGCIEQGRPYDRLVLGVAGWMRYAAGTDEQGKPIDIRDPLAEKLRGIAGKAGLSAERLAPALLGIASIFGDDLPRQPDFRSKLEAALGRLFREGSRHTVAAVA